VSESQVRLGDSDLHLTVDRKWREFSLVTRSHRHYYTARYGFSTFRTVHKRRVVFLMWKGRTIWIRSY